RTSLRPKSSRANASSWRGSASRTRAGSPPRSGSDGEAPAVHLRPELLPPLRCVAQGPQAQHHRPTAFGPLHPPAAQPLLDDHLAPRLRPPAADRLVRLHSGGVVHPPRPRLVGEVGDRLLDILVGLGPGAFTGQRP